MTDNTTRFTADPVGHALRADATTSDADGTNVSTEVEKIGRGGKHQHPLGGYVPPFAVHSKQARKVRREFVEVVSDLRSYMREQMRGKRAGVATNPPSPAVATALPSVDPATQNMSALFRASFTALPWVGLASAGTSLGQDLSTLADAPTAGTAVNGFTPMDLDGGTQCAGGDVMSSFVPVVTGWTACFVFLARTADADAGPGTRWTRPCIFADSAVYFVCAYTDSGITMEMANGTDAATTLTVPCSTNVWHFVRCGYNGTSFFLQVDNGTLFTEAYNVTGMALTGILQVGCVSASDSLDGKILDFMISPDVLPAATVDGIARNAQARYAQSYGF